MFHVHKLVEHFVQHRTDPFIPISRRYIAIDVCDVAVVELCTICQVCCGDC